jgi:hypothetical protein
MWLEETPGTQAGALLVVPAKSRALPPEVQPSIEGSGLETAELPWSDTPGLTSQHYRSLSLVSVPLSGR